MKEELIKIYSYKLSKEIIDKCVEEERKITGKDVEIEVHQILKDNNIQYKNKLNEVWSGHYKTPKYDLNVEIYVNIKDAEKANYIIKEYLNK